MGEVERDGSAGGIENCSVLVCGVRIHQIKYVGYALYVRSALNLTYVSLRVRFSRYIPLSLLLTLARRPRAPRGTRRSPTPGPAPNYSRQGSLSQPPLATVDREDGKPLYLCSPFVNSALVKGNFKTIVVLPKYVDIMEWVAVNSEHLLVLPARHFSSRSPAA